MSDEATYSRKLRDFAALWRRKSRDGRLPSRRDFAFEEMIPWLGWIAILKVLDEGRDFLFALHGTQIVERHRQDLTGVKASDMPKVWRESAMPGYLETMRAPRLLFTRHRIETERYDYAWERLIAPCADDGAHVDTMFLIVEDIDYRELGSR